LRAPNFAPIVPPARVDQLAGIVLLLSPLNMRYQMRSARSKIVAKGGNVARFDRFLHSRTLRYCYIITPICGAVLIIAALINP
jgi:hypothetical protein